ncbi:acetate/propionate family kinase [Pseudonocardia acaciae]|uniref:acetate/propionate family kinase n=1 Tax=Pseudonocardia acaciae TaxID=551276 RepID=UPI0009FBB511|nr:acetate/propionate family kinase [Pseudonocardia acaciae]
MTFVLVVNAGSSSLKLRVLNGDDDVVDRLDLERWSGEGETERLERFLRGQVRVDAVGHRIVHGGTEFTDPVVIDKRIRDRIAALAELAPLHQPRGVAGIDALTRLLPDTPAVACFDTAFHAHLPAPAATYALPHDWNHRYRLRRYGFHGLSHAHAASQAARMLGRPITELRTVTAHLGAGASLAAVDGGRSVDTTMGFTPLAGLVMATRTGSVDPGLVLWLARHAGLDLDRLSDVLEHESGLAGLAGIPGGDMRELERAAGAGDERATLAFDVYTHRLRREIAAMTAALGGLDALVFTGGVGEHSARVRHAAADGLAYLGIALDRDLNHNATPDADITAPQADVRTLVVTAREDLRIAADTRAALAR